MFDLFIIFAFAYILSVIVLSIGYAFIFGLITFWFEILIISLIVSFIWEYIWNKVHKQMHNYNKKYSIIYGPYDEDRKSTRLNSSH